MTDLGRRWESVHAHKSAVTEGKTAWFAIHARTKDCRREHLHRISTRIVHETQVICVETLDVKTMTASAKGTKKQPGTGVTKQSRINRALLDASMSELLRQIRYKADGMTAPSSRCRPNTPRARPAALRAQRGPRASHPHDTPGGYRRVRASGGIGNGPFKAPGPAVPARTLPCMRRVRNTVAGTAECRFVNRVQNTTIREFGGIPSRSPPPISPPPSMGHWWPPSHAPERWQIVKSCLSH